MNREARLTATYELKLPWGKPPPGLDGKTLRRQTRFAMALVRAEVAKLAYAAKIPVAESLVVELIWAPLSGKRHDPQILHPLLDTCCAALGRPQDDLVGLDLVPDSAHIQRMPPRVVQSNMSQPPGMWLRVTVRPQ